MSEKLKNKDFIKNIIKLPKEEKKKVILNYIKDVYKNEKRFVSKREVRKVFHVEIYNYFGNIFDMYQKIGVDVPLCFCPEDYAKKKIIEFIREMSKKRLYPMKTEIENELKIHIYTYFKDINDIYNNSKINFGLYKERKYQLEHPLNSNEHNQKNIDNILNYIKEKTKKGFYPGASQIQKKLNLAFYKYFNNIQEAYKKANVNYKRISPIILGKNKEEILTKIVVILLKKMGYKIERVSIFDKKLFNKGEDIRTTNTQNKKVLIELKAYRKDYNIIKREINQLQSYLIKQKISKGIFITTSNKINYKLPNIEVINGYKLISLLRKYNLNRFINKIRWIQEERTNLHERINFIELKRKEIIDFIVNFDGIPTKKEIEDNLSLDMRSYFKNIHNFDQLIKEIKIKFNNDNKLVYKDHQQELLCNLPVPD